MASALLCFLAAILPGLIAAQGTWILGTSDVRTVEPINPVNGGVNLGGIDIDTSREGRIIVQNTGISVPFGREKAIDPNSELVINVEEGDLCTIKVLPKQSAPLSQIPGRLVPSNFPCDFGPGEVKYVHFGSRKPQTDKVTLQLRYDTNTDTFIIPFTIDVRVESKQLEIVTRNVPLEVADLMGLSDALNEDKLQFDYDSATQVCKVTVLSSSSGLPRYGMVMNHDEQGQMIDCTDFLALGIQYRHTAATASPREDYIPLVVELQNRDDGQVVKQEYFQSMVRIRNGEENTPPSLVLTSDMMMEVDQFVMTAITPSILAAEDLETPADMLIFNITSQTLGPDDGMIVSTDDRNQPITSFTQKDLRDLKIAYKPPPRDTDVQSFYQIEFEIVDSELATSEPHSLTIVVKPKNTLAPVVTTNTGLVLFEGQSRPLLGSQNLGISDEDNLQDVIIAPINGSRYGELRIGSQRIKQFTIGDLIEGAVTYHHYGTDTYSDNIIFRMTDGQHEVEFLFPIIIAPIDDESPIVDVNTGVVVNEGGEVPITGFVLSATDIDSDDTEIRFVLELPLSDMGSLFLRQVQIPVDPQNWISKDNFYEREVREFTLEDIMNGHLFYQHGGSHNQNPIFDRILFRVVDSADPQPNESPVQEFLVKVMPQDLQPPEMFEGISLQLSVDEFQITPILKKNLRFTDMDSNDRDLKYTIVSPLADSDINNLLPVGDIVLTDEPDVPINMFTQAQINHMKVSYKPPSTELGIAPRAISFSFVVQDTQGNMGNPHSFVILLRPVDNQPPTITNTGVRVFERGTTIIDQTMLDATDPDTDRNSIRVIVVQPPAFGTVSLDGIPLQKGDEFTLFDIEQGDVTYVSGNAEETSDTVNLEVTDGVHVVPIVIHVNVAPIDDEAPTLDLPPGTIGSFLEVQENSFSLITSNILSASDPDTEDLLLSFIVDRQPREGRIESNGAVTDVFTQQDIVNGLVRYVHTGGEIGPIKREDSFNLTLSDMSPDWILGGNQITQVEVYVTILPVDNLAPNVTMGVQFYVDESGKGNINLTHLQAPDNDTEDDDILCTIVVGPSSGYLENIAPAPGSEKSRGGMPISAFSIKDLRLNHINYVQSIHRGVEPEEDQFTFRCTDGVNESPNFLFPINILPVNDEEPKVYTRLITVNEGGQRIIDQPLLRAEDGDVPADELHFFIVSAPEHGSITYTRLEGDIPILNFTMDQIANGNDIKYIHDDSETTEDSFTLLLTDGKYEVTKEVLISILEVDDETPRLTINDGIDIEIGETRLINNRILKATDLDSADSNLTYTVRHGPEHGLLQRLNKFDGSVVENITLGMNFTQWEVDNQRIRYVHTGDVGGRDLIKFDITDGTNPLIDRYFYVTVAHIDNVHPSIINAGVTMQEGSRVTLTTSIISTSDLNSPDEDLLFTITRAPTKGHLESTDNPGMPINSFTQLDLAGSKIYYVHTADDEIRMDSFQFEVTDGFNTVVRTFRISFTDIDNKEPVVRYDTVRLQEGDNKLITPFELAIDDRDSPDTALRFTITQLPIHGNILRNNTELVTEFTMHDINENLISYQHDGSEQTTDSFSFIVTDGTHNEFYVLPDITTLTRQPQQVPIEIVPVDNGAPQIVVNRGAPTLDLLGTGELGFMITNKYLMAEDRDSVDNSLLYVITTQPQYGYIMNIALGNVSITNFTQSDVNNMYIQYVVYPNVDATSDTFFVSVRDAGGNQLPNQPFRLNWSWISLEREYYEVNETERYLNIKLIRRGYLGETSFVGIQTADGTAIADDDFRGKSARQVQFNPGQTEGFWRVRILNDRIFEQAEVFEIILHDPVMGALEYPDRAVVTIFDAEDESGVFIDLPDNYVIEEDLGEFLVPIRRTGDLSQELMASCFTIPGSATGSDPSPVLTFSDYISRMEEDPDNMVAFDKGEDLAYCRILIIDDSLYEEDETFQVQLSNPMGGRIGSPSQINVIIAGDTDDVPSFYFGEPEYKVDENTPYIEVTVFRTGTDVSKMASVTVRSRASNPVSAIAGEDYAGISRNLDFAPGVNQQTVKVYIIDDRGQPRLEGPETFELVLNMPMNGVLGLPSKTVITINDTISDLPKVEFRHPAYEVNENDITVTAEIVRTGDLSIESSVRCYTRQGSAQVMMDYDERPNTEASHVTFLPGERTKTCTVLLMGDNIFEPDESFRLVLGSPRTASGVPAVVGEQNVTVITVHDVGDAPVIKFPETKFSVDEPTDLDSVATVSITVIRMGDSSQTSVVRVFTKDGSARSGMDYNPLSQVLEFGFNVTERVVEIEILPDEDRNEMREAFTLHITNDQMMIADVQMNHAIIYIEQEGQASGVTFPSQPVVVSLLDYDDIPNARNNPPRGYPLVCVSPCNPKYPDFATTGPICDSEGLNDTVTQFRWMVSAPTSDSGVTSPLRQADSDTFFSTTKSITLDSIYFGPGSRVQCVARAIGSEGDAGREHPSPAIIISTTDGMCMPRVANAIGAEPFTARMRYTGPADPDFPNKVRLTVTMPHVDGMLPVISTRQLSNFELALSKDGYRVGTHRCSNLLDYDEVPTDFGFITEETKNPNVVGDTYAYQYSPELRGEETLRFYRNLNLEACLWEFNAYYDMSELLDECGGLVGTDGQVLDLVQSYVSMRIPLFVSFVFHSPVATGGWKHFDQQSTLQLTFVYDTSILWQNGIGSQVTTGTQSLQGNLYPTSMRIDEDGRLVVNFRTEALFNGLFVQSHQSTDVVSTVNSLDHAGLTYSLSLLRTEPTYAQPEQLWQFVSDLSVSDYSGTYTIQLIPCTTLPNTVYSQPPVCNPEDTITFELPIRFQQVSDPVPEEYSLNTEFVLVGKESIYLSDGSMGFGEGSDVAYNPGDTIFGRIHVDPVQALGEGFNLDIQKVFLCTGRDGYIPKYNPANNEYGCVADTPNLLYAFKILDRGAPDTITQEFNGIPFNATLAIDNTNDLQLVQQPGADGFRLASDALFGVDYGRTWYLHSIYSMRSSETSGIGKRETEHHAIASRQRRQADTLVDTAQGQGTNMKRIALQTSTTDIDNKTGGTFELAPAGTNMVMIAVIIGVILVILLVALVIGVVVRRRQAKQQPVVVVNGSAKVVSNVHFDDNTEV